MITQAAYGWTVQDTNSWCLRGPTAFVMYAVITAGVHDGMEALACATTAIDGEAESVRRANRGIQAANLRARFGGVSKRTCAVRWLISAKCQKPTCLIELANVSGTFSRAYG